MDNNITQAESLSARKRQQKAGKKSIKISISIKVAIIIIVIIALGVLAYVFKGLFIAATVDGSPISRLAIIKQLEKASGKTVLDSIIAEKLIQNEAKTKGIIISNDEISAQIKIIQDQFAIQGSTLDAALVAEGMTMEDLKKQIIIQMKIEKLVADKINVTDEEVAQYIADNAISIPEGQEATTAAQVKDELRNQKLSTEAKALITTLESQAKIRYFISY